MGEVIEALILGVIQGLTEFLPVSSSGHLELMKYILNDDSLAEQSMMTTVFLHFATALSTIVVFRKDIFNLIRKILSNAEGTGEARLFALFILISMIPAAIVGVFFDEILESLFQRRIILVSSLLIITGMLLLISERIKVKKKKLNASSAFIIGLSQACAILPGLSRSGSTIATALLLGINRTQAARFSFLMVIPLILGKMAKDLLSGELMANAPSSSYLLIGFSAALITGILACTAMINLVKASKLSWFALYCFIIGIGMINYKLVVG